MDNNGLKRLRVYARMFFDSQEYRKAVANQLRAGDTVIDVEISEQILAMYMEAEKAVDKLLVATYREVISPSIQAWQRHEDSKGIGEHLLALLLGTIGHPRIATPFHWESAKEDTEPRSRTPESNGKAAPKRVLVPDEPYARNIGKLWAYCGHGDPDRKRRTGMTAEDGRALGNPEAKKLTWLLATSTLKARGRYAEMYQTWRYEYSDRAHAKPCAPCGKVGHPAEAGTPWRPGHQNAAAIRRVGKEILRDLWIAAPEVHERSVAQIGRDLQVI